MRAVALSLLPQWQNCSVLPGELQQGHGQGAGVAEKGRCEGDAASLVKDKVQAAVPISVAYTLESGRERVRLVSISSAPVGKGRAGLTRGCWLSFTAS